MATFGEKLRRERQQRKISLEDMSQATKITVRMLQAIEDEQYDRLPGGIFNRSFVRAYARYLGMDEEATVKEFLLSSGESTALVLHVPEVFAPPKPRPKRRSPLLWPAVAVLTLAAGAAGGYFFWRPGQASGHAWRAAAVAMQSPLPSPTDAGTPNSPANANSSTDTQAGTTALSGSEPGLNSPVSSGTTGSATSTPAPAFQTSSRVATLPQVVPASQTAQGGAPAQTPSATTATLRHRRMKPVENANHEAARRVLATSTSVAPVPQTTALNEGTASSSTAAPTFTPVPAASEVTPARRDIVLEVEAKAPSWVFVTADGAKALEATMAAGERRRIVAHENVKLLAGDAAAVSVVLNGQPQPPLGAAGETGRFEFPAIARSEQKP